MNNLSHLPPEIMTQIMMQASYDEIERLCDIPELSYVCNESFWRELF